MWSFESHLNYSSILYHNATLYQYMGIAQLPMDKRKQCHIDIRHDAGLELRLVCVCIHNAGL